MPVTRIAAAQRAQLLAGNLTSHDIDVDVAVNPNAGPYVYGIAHYGWTGGVSVSGDTITCDWPGATLYPLLATPLLFGSDQNTLMGWIVEDPPSATVEASHSGIGTGLDTRSRFLTVGVWAQAEPLDLDNIQDAVVSAVGSSSVASHTITVPSILPASRVITGHLVGRGKKVSAYNGTRVASAATSGGGQLLMGECRGAESVDSTVTHNVNTGLWAALGLNLDPAPVAFGASGRHKAGSGSFGGEVYGRWREPHPDRYYVVPPVGSAPQGAIAGNFARSADGVLMPVWPKDPDDSSDYTLNWTNHLAEDDKITHVEHTISGTLRRFSQAVDETGHMTQVWINGATIDVARSVRVRCSTAKGRRFDRTFWIAGTNN